MSASTHIKESIPYIEESERFPGLYHLYMGEEFMEKMSPAQMFAIVTLLTRTLDSINYKPEMDRQNKE